MPNRIWIALYKTEIMIVITNPDAVSEQFEHGRVHLAEEQVACRCWQVGLVFMVQSANNISGKFNLSSSLPWKSSWTTARRRYNSTFLNLIRIVINLPSWNSNNVALRCKLWSQATTTCAASLPSWTPPCSGSSTTTRSCRQAKKYHSISFPWKTLPSTTSSSPEET